MKNVPLILLVAIVAGLAMSASVSAGEVVRQEVETVQSVQPVTKVQTRQRTVIDHKTITEQVPVSSTITTTETRQRTVMVPQVITEQVPVQKTIVSMQTRQRTVAVPRRVIERVHVQVMQPVQSIAIGMEPNGRSGRRGLRGLLGPFSR